MTIYPGENIKRLRREKELTQETLAEFLGVTFQSVSKWERGESFPDITMLPDIADFFKISVDELLGVNKAEREKEIAEKLTKYDNLTDSVRMREIITLLKAKYPNDFRVLIRYLGCLVRFSEDTAKIAAEAIAIYDNIQKNCTDDRIRIKAKRAVIELYHSLCGKENSGISFDNCENMITQMPNMRDSREMFCFFYPESHPQRDERIRNTLEEQFLLLHTVFSHFFFYDERFSDAWQLTAFKQMLDALNFVYDDGNYGKMWQTVIYDYGHLGVRYCRLSDVQNALLCFEKMCDLATEFDSMDRITVMHSTLFEGKAFDKYTLGSTYSAKKRVRTLLTEKYPLPDAFKASGEFKRIVEKLTKN